MLHNCCFLHADIKDDRYPKIHLKFGECNENTQTQSIYSETLSLEKDDNNGKEYNISGLESSSIPISKQEKKKEDIDSITALDLLNVAIPFAIADAICDTSYHEAYLSQNVKAFGASGKQEVLDFKIKFLGPQKLVGKPAYQLCDPFYVNVQERKVTFGFECLIEKYVGEGTDYMYFDEDLKVKHIDAVRKTGKYSD